MGDLRQIWDRGEPAFGAWLAIPTAYSAEVLGQLGFDWLCVDMQHGLADYSQMLVMLQAIQRGPATALVRVPWNEPGIIGRALDAGADGVIVPMVNSRSEAQAAVAACRYPPLGRRSYGPIRAALVRGRGYYETANDEVLCIPMVETREALGNLDEIVGTEGVDAVYIGPSDLGVALGVGPAADRNPQGEFRDALDRIVAACRRHDVVPGCAGTVETVERRVELGFQMVEVSRDGACMARAAAADLAEARRCADARAEEE